jgi:hypothetical protein
VFSPDTRKRLKARFKRFWKVVEAVGVVLASAFDGFLYCVCDTIEGILEFLEWMLGFGWFLVKLTIPFLIFYGLVWMLVTKILPPLHR